MISKDTIFPFSAIVGQENIKKALIWNVINPNIGGVLISGEKGTAKSTLIRGLCAVTSGVDLVELPLNITEDRLIGTVNFEHAVKYGEKRFENGILKKADGNILYVDEVNLLSDHIVKSLLEIASSGINLVEREGISFCHKSRFILIGSMNPEEGGLRPQFLDKFGLYVEVKAEQNIRKRSEIIRRRIEYENHTSEFLDVYRSQNDKIKLHINQAKEALKEVIVTENAMQIASVIAKEANCEGHRAELIIIETAKAIAACDFRTVLNISDIKEAAKFALPHRTVEQQEQQQPDIPNESNEPEDNSTLPDNQENDNEENNNEENNNQTNEPQMGPEENPKENEEQLEQQGNDLENESSDSEFDDTKEYGSESPDEESEMIYDVGESFEVAKWLSDKSRKIIAKGSGKRSLVKTSSNQGRYVRYRYPIKGHINDIAIDATLRAAAPYQCYRDKNGLAFSIKESDIRIKTREKRTGNTILFVVDASGSMGANKRMESVKGAILSLLNDAYQKRDRVGLIVFRKQSAELLLGITRSVELAQKELVSLPTGGRTPLEAGLDLAYDVIKVAKIKDKDLLPVIVLVSDGKATYSKKNSDPFKAAIISAKKIGEAKIKSVVIDTDQSFIKLYLSEKIAQVMNAELFKIEDLQAQDLITAVKVSL